MLRRDGKLSKIFLFQLHEFTAVEEFLAKMAMNGWMLDEVKRCKFIFTHCEPVELKFSVKIFDKASEFDSFKCDENLTYIDYCEKAGWQYIGNNGKLQFFYSDNMDTVPIETEPKLELKIINKNMLFRNIFSWFGIPIMGFTSVRMQTSNFSYFISSYMAISSILLWIVLLIFSLSNSMDYLFWYIQSKSRIKKGKMLKYRSIKAFRIIWSINIILLLISLTILSLPIIDSKERVFILGLMGMIIGIILFSLILNYFIKHGKLSAKTNRIITWVVGIFMGIIISGVFISFALFNVIHDDNAESITYKEDGGIVYTSIHHDVVPITLEDFGIEANGHRNSIKYENKTIFAQHISYSDYCFTTTNPEEKGISYEVFESKYQWVIDKYMDKEWINSRYHINLIEEDAAYWKADKVYKQIYEDGGFRYVAMYGKKVLVVELNTKPTESQIDLFIEKLELN
ncbi:MAG: DUF2812 domain-containing protein [Clostridiaceae bacterium]